MSESLERKDFNQTVRYENHRPYPEFLDQDDGVDLRHYWRVLAKRKWLVLAVLMSITVAVVLEVLTATPIYRATATVRIDPEASNVLPYKDVTQASESYLATESFLRTQYNILSSRVLARRVIETLNLVDDPVFDEVPRAGVLLETAGSLKSLLSTAFSLGGAAEPDRRVGESQRIDRFVDNLEINPIRRSRLVEVNYQSHHPGFAAKVVNTLMEEFIERNFESKYQATVRATDFLQKELEDLKLKVERSEEGLILYARQHGILNIDQRENVVVQRLADLNQEITQVQANLIAKTALHSVVKGATVEDFPQSLKSQAILELEKRRFELEQDLASLSTRFGPEWPEIKKTREEVSKVEQQLRQEKESTIREVRLQYQVTRDHYRLLTEALEQQTQLANQLSQDSIQYNILKREVEVNKQLYEGLLQRLKEAGVSAGLKSSNIQVVDRAEVPHEIYRPQKTLNGILGLTVGLILGIGITFLMESLDNTFKTPDQVEELLAIPALGVIPRIAADGGISLDRRLLPGRSEVLKGDVGKNDHPVRPGTDPGRPYIPGDGRIWEAYRSLRTSLVLSVSGGQPKTILVTSSFSGEGKTTTAANLGVVFSQTGDATLLIDLDMRKPMLAKNFGINGHGGMSTFLSGNSDLASHITRTSVANLFILPAGPVPPNPAELLGSAPMVKALELLKQHFKYIVIDSPPVLSVTDPLILSAKVDGVVLVVQGGKTPRDVVRRASDHIRVVGGKILGALINNVNVESSEYYYYYRNYYDYGYDSPERTG